MLALLLLLSGMIQAQELDLSSIRKLEEKLPSYHSSTMPQGSSPKRAVGENKFSPTLKVTSWEKIQKSGSELGSVNGKITLVRLADNKVFSTQRPLYLRYYKLEDEHGFKYLLNQDGSTTFKIDSTFVSPIKEELSLYEPPVKYTPAPLNISKRTFDKKLTLIPQAGLYMGYVMGDFMKDLFNDPNARTGFSNQLGVNIISSWNLPMKVGASLHYEKTAYNLTGGGKVNYSSLSFGPLFKTKDMEISGHKYRAQVQLRVSPFANAVADTRNGSLDFKFNSTDLFLALEHPVKNSWGEYVLGGFFQAQWLNLKDQPEIVSIRASNKANTSFGLSLSQVFQ